MKEAVVSVRGIVVEGGGRDGRRRPACLLYVLRMCFPT